MGNILRKIGLTVVAQDILIIIFAIMILSMKTLLLNTFVIVIGAFCILKGVIEICKYIMAKGVSEFYKDDLIFGIVAIVLGIVLIVFKDSLFWMLRLSIGLYVVLSAIKNIYLAIKVRKYNLKEWIPMIVLSLIMLVVGIMIIARKGLLINLCAYVMIAFAVLDIINNIIFIIGSKEIFDN